MRSAWHCLTRAARRRHGTGCERLLQMSAADAPTEEIKYFSSDFAHSSLECEGSARLTELAAAAVARGAAASAEDAAALEPAALARAWNSFHASHRGGFFHPRRYILAEFPELRCTTAAQLRSLHPLASSARATPPTDRSGEDSVIEIVEIGAGNGSNIGTLSAANPSARLYACDYAPAALKWLRRNEAAAAATKSGTSTARRTTNMASQSSVVMV